MKQIFGELGENLTKKNHVLLNLEMGTSPCVSTLLVQNGMCTPLCKSAQNSSGYMYTKKHMEQTSVSLPLGPIPCTFHKLNSCPGKY